jgi:hypothetical protein
MTYQKTPRMCPIVNLGGTSRDDLVRTRIEARRAIYEAMRALHEVAPHGRDYIGNRDAWQRDNDIYRERFRTLDHMANDLLDEAVELAEDYRPPSQPR